MTNPKLAVSASVIRYLLALAALKGAGGIRTTDVARYLNIKKPSAHTMLNNLKEAEILPKDALGLATELSLRRSRGAITAPLPRLSRAPCRLRQT